MILYLQLLNFYKNVERCTKYIKHSKQRNNNLNKNKLDILKNNKKSSQRIKIFNNKWLNFVNFLKKINWKRKKPNKGSNNNKEHMHKSNKLLEVNILFIFRSIKVNIRTHKESKEIS